MKTFWVYIVLCSDASYYIGITNDVERRVAEHNLGTDRHCYTFARRPVSLTYATEFPTPDEAIRFEKQIKGWSRKKKAALIAGDWNTIVSLSREARH